MQRFRRSWAIAQQCLKVLRANPGLIAFPVLTSVVTALLMVSMAAPAYFALRGSDLEQGLPPAGYALLAIFYLVSYFIVIFFNVALSATAIENLQGQPADFRFGLQHAGKQIKPILGWTVVAATVGLILKKIGEETGVIGKVMVGLIGGAWNILTFFAIPVVAAEGVGPVEAFKRSAQLMKATWGESLIGTGGIGMATFLFAMIPVPVIALSCVSQMPVIIGIAIVLSVFYWIALAAVSSSLDGVYRSAVFLYANTGAIPEGFETDWITGAFKVKERRMKFGRRG